MPAFLFALSNSIKVPATETVATIVGRAEFVEKENQYCLEWTEQTGSAIRWFTEPELTGAIKPESTEPDARCEPTTQEN